MITIAAIILFVFSVFCGMVLAMLHSMKVERPWTLTILHGVFAVSALVFLAVAVLSGAMPTMKLALILFVVTALGGMFLVSFRLRGKDLPTPALVVHAVLAAAAFVALVLNFGAIKL